MSNKEINGKQCTIAWYLDNNKVTHVDLEVVTSVIYLTKGHFGCLTVHIRNNQDDLVTNISINKEKNLKIESKHV